MYYDTEEHNVKIELRMRLLRYSATAIRYCLEMRMRSRLLHSVRYTMHTHDTRVHKIEEIKMAESICEMSSEMGDNHGNVNLFNGQHVFEVTPTDVAELAKGAFNDLLPAKSKERYELEYTKFNDYKKKIRITSSSENILMAYFTELKKKYKPSSLWNYYSMLKKTLTIKEKIDIGQYCALTSLLKKEAKGFQTKKAKVFTVAQMNKFLQEAANIQYVAHKVWIQIKVFSVQICVLHFSYKFHEKYVQTTHKYNYL